MAENETPPIEEQPEGAPPDKSRFKTLIIVSAVMILEAALFITFASMANPDDANADQLVADDEAKQNQTVNVLVFKGRIEHLGSGHSIVYDTEVFVAVRARDAKGFEIDLESNNAQVITDLRAIVRRSEVGVFQEPPLAPLTRQFMVALDQRFGASDDDEEPVIREVFITRCLPIRTNI